MAEDTLLRLEVARANVEGRRHDVRGEGYAGIAVELS
jgi:hypothetical protein